MNKVMIEGKLGGDAEVKTSGNGKTFITFSVAVNEGVTQDTKKTTWFDVVVFGYEAEFAKLLKKGDSVFIIGRFEKKVYNEKTYFSVIAESIYYSLKEHNLPLINRASQQNNNTTQKEQVNNQDFSKFDFSNSSYGKIDF
jgi:single-strand DNA-binding protein